MAMLNILPCYQDWSNWELQTTVLLHIFNAESQYTPLVVYTAVHPKHGWLLKALCTSLTFCNIDSLQVVVQYIPVYVDVRMLALSGEHDHI